MTRDADNDNPTVSGAGNRAQASAQSWQTRSEGNAALAAEPAAEVEDQEHIYEQAEQREPERSEAEQVTETALPPSLPEAAFSDGTNSGLTASLPNSNAIPISALGVSIPHRPIPAVHGTGLQVRMPSKAAHRHQLSRDLGKQGSEHLFNLPPRPEPHRAEPSPMEKAINAKPRTPLTSQPGFVAGLVAALVSGGAIYGYLVF